jgi:hypothetical protein
MKRLLVAAALLLSAFNGLLNLSSVLIFSSNESTRLWASICLPAALWLIAIACFKSPRAGAVAFALIWFISLILCFDPAHHPLREQGWGQCADNIRFSMVGGILLLINVAIPKRAQ